MSAELDRAVGRAARATLDLYKLMAAHGVRNIEELRLLLEWPAGMRDARAAWLAAMTTVAAELAATEGIRDARALSDRDKVRLAHKAYDLVLSSPAEAAVRLLA